MIKKLLSCILAAIVCFASFSCVAFANDVDTEEPDVPIDEYVYITSTNGSIYKSGLTIYCDATMTTNTSKSLRIDMVLQRKLLTGSTYSEVETWHATKTGTSLSLSKTHSYNALYKYRIKCTFTAGGESEMFYRYL